MLIVFSGILPTTISCFLKKKTHIIKHIPFFKQNIFGNLNYQFDSHR